MSATISSSVSRISRPPHPAADGFAAAFDHRAAVLLLRPAAVLDLFCHAAPLPPLQVILTSQTLVPRVVPRRLLGAIGSDVPRRAFALCDAANDGALAFFEQSPRLREARRDRAALLALLHALQRAGSGRFAGSLRGGGGRRRRWFGVGGRLHRLFRRRRDRLGVLRLPRSIIRIAPGVGLATEELRHAVLVPHGTARVVVEGGCARYDETAFPRGFISVPFFPFFRATDRKLWTDPWTSQR